MIGVFDSGYGGLTVLRALSERLPEERFLYLGDNAFAPYGKRAPEEIFQLTRRGVRTLFEAGCGLVILACNTASAVALRRLQQEWLPDAYPGRNVLGVFVPVIETVSGQNWHPPGTSPYAPPQPAKTIGLFATRRTVESKAFPAEVRRHAPHLKVIQHACPRLAEAIEEGWNDADIGTGIHRYVAGLLAKGGRTPPDLIVLGCTHYPLAEQHFRAALPLGTPIVDQPAAVADALVRYLDRHPEFRRAADEPMALHFLTTGDPGRVGAFAERFFGTPCEFHHPTAPLAVERRAPETELDDEPPIVPAEPDEETEQ